MPPIPNYTYDTTIPRVGGGNAWSIKLAQDRIFVGGSFSTFGGSPRVNLGAFDATTKALLPIAPIIGGAPITDMLFLNGVLYVVALGAIVTAAGPVRQGAAAFDINGNLLPWDPNCNAPVYAIATDGTNIFLGGQFTTVGGNPYSRIVKVDAVNGTPDPSFAASADGQVSDIVWDDTTSSVYIAGQFANINSTSRNFAARVDALGALMAWNPNFNSPVNSLVLANSLVYAGGFFVTVNGGTTRNGLAALDPVTGIANAQNFGMTTASSIFNVSYNLANGFLYIGGGLGTIQSLEPYGMAVFDPTTEAIQQPITSFSGPIIYFEFSGTWVLVAGFFQHFYGDFNVNGTFGSFNYGSSERSSYQDPGAPAPGSYGPQALATDGVYIYVGTVAGQTMDGNNGSIVSQGLIRYDLNRNIDMSFNPVFIGGIGSQVRKIVIDGGLIYASGLFAFVNANPRDGFAVLDLSGNVQAIDLGLSMSPAFAIQTDIPDFALDSTHIYVVGTFLWVNGPGPGPNYSPSIARFDRSTGIWDNTWAPVVLPIFNTGYVYEIELDSNFAYLGGRFTTVGGQPFNNIVRIPLAGGGAPDLTWNFDVLGGPGSTGAYSLSLDSNGDLYVAGVFATIGGVSAKGISKILAAGAVDVAFTSKLSSYNMASGSYIEKIGPDVILSADPDSGPPRGPADGSFWLGSLFSTDSDGDLSWFTPQAENGYILDALSFGGRLFFVGAWGVYFYTSPADGGFAAFYAPALPPTGLPRAPKISFLNRRPLGPGQALTMFRWQEVTRDLDGNPTAVTSYRIYRSASKNLEDPYLIAEITTRDLADRIDTLFIESIEGYYRYCVSAVNSAGEGEKSCANFASTEQLERLR